MSGGGGSQQSTTTVNQLYSPEEAARRAQLMAEAERIYGTTRGIPMSWEGPAPSAATQQGQQMVTQAATGAGQQIAGLMGDATTFGMRDVLNPQRNPALLQTIDTATRKVGQAYTDPGGVISRIRHSFDATNSGGSSTREGIAGGIAGREYLNTIGDVTGRLTSDAYNKGLDTFSRTMALAPQNIQTAAMPGTMVSAVGQQQEAYDEAAKQWQLRAPWEAVSPYASIIYGGSAPGTQTTATAPGPRGPGAVGALGAAGAGAMMGYQMGGPWGAAAGGAAGLLMSLFAGR